MFSAKLQIVLPPDHIFFCSGFSHTTSDAMQLPPTTRSIDFFLHLSTFIDNPPIHFLSIKLVFSDLSSIFRDLILITQVFTKGLQEKKQFF